VVTVSACRVGPPVPVLFFIVSTFNCDILLFLFSYLCSYEWWVIILLFESSYEGYAMITIPEPPEPA